MEAATLAATLLTVTLAGAAWFATHALGESNRIDAGQSTARELARRIEDRDFARASDVIAALANHPIIVAHVSRGELESQSVDAVLLQARLTLHAAIVYVLNHDGLVISCSTDGPSLVGRNYGFRPYFQRALRGENVVYGALGVTTARRGFYFTAPIGSLNSPQGVVVAKLDLHSIDQELAALPVPAALISPDGIVFSTNQKDWLFHASRPLSSARRAALLSSRQFARQPLPQLPVDLSSESVLLADKGHTALRIPLRTATGWQIVVADPVRPFPMTAPQQRFFLSSAAAVATSGLLVIALLIAMTRRVRAELQLRHAEENLALTLDSIGDGIVATDANGNITRMNPVAVRLTGWPLEEALGRPLAEVMRQARTDDLIDSEQPTQNHSVASQDSVLVARNGKAFHIAECATPIRAPDNSAAGVVVVFRDITEQRQLREDLHQAQKMEAVGQLAGGVAHDFNNLLTAIIGNAELLSMKFGNSLASHHIEEIVRASARAGELTRQLLTFSRKASVQPRELDVHLLIREVLSLASRGIDPKVQIETNLEAHRYWVQGDATQLQSALLNLCINASDAMPSGGKLTVSTRDVNSENVEPLLEISVADEGIGIPRQVRDRIFEPFFTTKPQGQGTGLGLAAVYGCVQSHSGTISVESEEGVGTTFRVLLPARDENDTPSEVPSAAIPPNDQGHWLVVDDERAVREFTQSALETLGCRVTVANDGLEAIEYFTANADEIDGIVLDLAMPRMSGEEVLHRVRALRLSTPIVLVSGFAKSRVRALLDQPNTEFLQKPFHISDLARAITNALEARQSSSPTCARQT